MKRTLSLLLSFLILCTLFSACGTEETAAEQAGGLHSKSGDLYPEAFLFFDGKEIPFSEFRYYFLNYRDMYLAEDPEYFKNEENETALKEEVLQCLLDTYAVRFLAKDCKVSLNSEEKEAVQASIDETASVFGSRDAYLSDLAASYMTETHYESMMEYSSLYYKLFSELFEEDGKEAFSDEEFYAFFEENYLAVQQIYLPFEEGETKENHPVTLTLAESVYEKAASGTDFWSLVQEYGKDDNMLDYPDGYYFTEGQAEDALYQAAKDLSVGSFSKPVVGETGLYLIKRVKMLRARMEENRETSLFGYRDSLDQWHPGEYDEVFFDLYRERADKIKVEYSSYWDEVSTESVY